MKNRMRMLAVVVALVAGLATAGTYELSQSHPGYFPHTVVDGPGAVPVSNTYDVKVPAGMVAKVSLTWNVEAPRLHRCGKVVLKQYVNGVRRNIFDKTTEFLSDGTITLSATASDPDVSKTVIYTDSTYEIANVPVDHYHHYYSKYSDYYATFPYDIYVEYESLLPDLVVSALSLSSEDAAVDETVTLTFTVKNAGRLAVTSSTVVRIFDGATVLGDLTIPALAAGESVSRTVTLPRLSAGTHTIRAEADRTNLVAEGHEGNNFATVSLRDYTRTPVSVTFDTNGGAASRVISVVAGNTVGALPEPMLRGFDFGGWWTEKDGGYRIDEHEKITRARTFFAHWVAAECALSLNRDGGSDGDVSAVARYGSGMPLIDIPTRLGSAFGGYWTEPDGGGVQYYDDCGRSVRKWDRDVDEATLYAKWTPLTCAVRFDLQGGSGASGPSSPALFGTMPTPIAPPVRSGWTFQGYYSSPLGEGYCYYDYGGRGVRAWDLLGEETALYAFWMPVNATIVRFDAMGGRGGPSEFQAQYAQWLPTVSCPTRAQYVFEGYYSAPSGGKQYYDANGNGVCKWDQGVSVTLYAHWSKAYHVMLDPNGGNGSLRPQYFTVPAWQLEANTFSRSGYVFAGWALERGDAPVFADGEVINAELLGYGGGPDDKVVTLYATWGRRLTTSLFPGVEFLTGGTNADSDWRVDRGSLRSSPAAGVSWLCVVLTGHDELDYSIGNAKDGAANCLNEVRFTVPMGIRLHVNDVVLKSAESLSLASSGRHLAVWSCKRTITSLSDWCGLGPTEDPAVIATLPSKKDAQFDELVPAVVSSALSGMGYSDSGYNHSSCEAAVRSTFAEKRSHWSGRGFCDLLLDCLGSQQGFSTSNLRYEISDRSARGMDFLKRCDSVDALAYDLATLERFLDGYAVLESLDWRRKALACFYVNDGSTAVRVQSALSGIEACQCEVQSLSDSICEKTIYLLRSRREGLSDYSEQVAEADIREVLGGFRRNTDGTVYALVEAINRRLLRDFAQGDVLTAWWMYDGYHYQLLAEVESHCADLVNRLHAIDDLELEIGRYGICERRLVSVGAPIGSLPEPERGGYAFAGWWTAPIGGARFTESSVLSTDTPVYAHWTPRTYQITFDSDGGSAIASRQLAYGERLGMLPVPSRPGYSFAGWYDQTAASQAASILDVVERDIVLKAQWTKDTVWTDVGLPAAGWRVVITLDARGGRVEGGTLSRMSGDLVGTLPTPRYDGFVFDGWWTSASGGSKVLASTPVNINYDIMLYAHWAKVEMGSGLSTAYSIAPNATVASSPLTLVRSFDGTQFGNGGTIVAKATLQRGRVYTFAKPHGDGTTLAVTGSGLPAAWYATAGNLDYIRVDLSGLGGSGTADYYAVFSGAIGARSTLYWAEGNLIPASAQWTSLPSDATFRLEFDANDGRGVVNSRKAVHGKAVGALPVPVRSGYVFDGWWTAADGGVRVTSETKMVTYDVRLYAHWGRIETGAWTGSAYPLAPDTTVRSGNLALVRAFDGESLLDEGAFYAKATLKRGCVYTFAKPHGDGATLAVAGSGLPAAWYATAGNLDYVLIDLSGLGGSGTADYYAVFSGAIGARSTLYWAEGNLIPASAQWTSLPSDATFRLEFDANDGRGVVNSRKAVHGKAVGALPVPVRSGYVFAGWWTAAEGGGRVTSETKMVTYDVRLYAHWGRIETGAWTGSAYLLAPDTTVCSGNLALVRAFDGEALLDEGAFYAKATLKRGRVYTFAKPHGDGATLAVTGAVQGLPAAWYATAGGLDYIRVDLSGLGGSGTADYYAVFSGAVGARSTLYWAEGNLIPASAQWTSLPSDATFRLEFDANDGRGVVNSRKAVHGKAVGALPVPVRSGYVFDGWWTAAEGGGRVTSETKMVTYDVRLYAHWTQAAPGSGVSTAYSIVPNAAVASSPVTLVRSFDGERFGNDGTIMALAALQRGRVYTFAKPHDATDLAVTGVGLPAAKYVTSGGLDYVRVDLATLSGSGTIDCYVVLSGAVGVQSRLYWVEGDYMP